MDAFLAYFQYVDRLSVLIVLRMSFLDIATCYQDSEWRVFSMEFVRLCGTCIVLHHFLAIVIL